MKSFHFALGLRVSGNSEKVLNSCCSHQVVHVLLVVMWAGMRNLATPMEMKASNTTLVVMSFRYTISGHLVDHAVYYS